jgi:hypothetical protein
MPPVHRRPCPIFFRARLSSGVRIGVPWEFWGKDLSARASFDRTSTPPNAKADVVDVACRTPTSASPPTRRQREARRTRALRRRALRPPFGADGDAPRRLCEDARRRLRARERRVLLVPSVSAGHYDVYYRRAAGALADYS